MISNIQSALALLYGARVAPHQVVGYLLEPKVYNLRLDKLQLEAAARIEDRCHELGIAILAISDNRYPYSLRIIPQPPPLIFTRGDLSVFDSTPGVAIVGSRDATQIGLEVSKRIANYLGRKGWCVVSGLALGIDAAAHEGALDAGAPTVAVLAHGLHRATPAKNSELAERILQSGGMWLSEHAPDVQPKPHYFVQRNRIQAGLSAGSIIVEGAIDSGSMTQAQFCLEQKRKLFAVVSGDGERPLRMNSAGPEMLVKRDGATPIRSMNDYGSVLELLEQSRASIASAQDDSHVFKLA